MLNLADDTPGMVDQIYLPRYHFSSTGISSSTSAPDMSLTTFGRAMERCTETRLLFLGLQSSDLTSPHLTS
jgi:hypothetical protein